MSVTLSTETLVTIDHFCDRIPFVSSGTNLYILYKQCVQNLAEDPPLIPKNTFTAYMQNKSTSRCILLLLPILGNVLVYGRDISDRNTKEELQNFILPCIGTLARELESFQKKPKEMTVEKWKTLTSPLESHRGYLRGHMEFIENDEQLLFSFGKLLSLRDDLYTLRRETYKDSLATKEQKETHSALLATTSYLKAAKGEFSEDMEIGSWHNLIDLYLGYKQEIKERAIKTDPFLQLEYDTLLKLEDEILFQRRKAYRAFLLDKSEEGVLLALQDPILLEKLPLLKVLKDEETLIDFLNANNCPATERNASVLVGFFEGALRRLNEEKYSPLILIELEETLLALKKGA